MTNSLSFNERFGEIRSLLNQTPYKEETILTLWDLIFAMATQDLKQFQSEVAPYIRDAAFFKTHPPTHIIGITKRIKPLNFTKK